MKILSFSKTLINNLFLYLFSLCSVLGVEEVIPSSIPRGIKVLLVTENYSSGGSKHGGGARLVDALVQAFGKSLSIALFDSNKAGYPNNSVANSPLKWHFNYPCNLPNRFENRVCNAKFIGEKVKSVVEKDSFTHVIFIHISLQFGLLDYPLPEKIHIWTFPMFLTPSYLASGEIVSNDYYEKERLTLLKSKNILTPSEFEKKQLMEIYGISKELIHVVPRGVDMKLFTPKVRFSNNKELLKFCSIGSIKPQKNTKDLINLFEKIRIEFPGSMLRIIGPVQDEQYAREVDSMVGSLGLQEIVEFTGHVPPKELSSKIKDCHFHLSTSRCETFGRSIFETLASGLPNVARLENNAAAEFLRDLPYARFVNNNEEALSAIKGMVPNLTELSSRSIKEIGNLYSDRRLSQQIVTIICN